MVTSGNLPTARTRLNFARLPVPRVLVTADDVARGKPHPEPYLLAARELRVSPADCVVIEDAPAGVQITTPGQAPGPSGTSLQITVHVSQG